MAESFGVEGRGTLLRGGRRDPRRHPEPPAAGGRAAWRWSRRSATTARRSATRRRSVLKAMRPLDAERRRARPVPRLPRRAGRRARLDGRDLRRRAAAHRHLALGRRAVLHPRRQVPARRPRPRCWSSSSARRATLFDEPDVGAPNYFRFRLSPDVAHRARARASSARARRWSGEEVELLAPPRASATSMPPYERLLGDAMRGDATLFAREDAVEAPWRVVDPVLDATHAAVTRTSRAPGDRRRRTAWWRLDTG